MTYKLTNDDIEQILKSLSHAQQKFLGTNYPTEQIKKDQLNRVDSALRHVQELKVGIINLTPDDLSLIEEVLKFTKMYRDTVVKYPTYDIRRSKIEQIEAVITNFRAWKKSVSI